MATILFWTAFTCIVYVYAGYPLLLMLWRRVVRRPVDKRYQEVSVSLVIVMHNERRNVQAKIQNCFELDYPADKLQIIVSLDAPTDGTDALLRQYTGQGVEVLSSPVRRGKAEALNSGLAAARGEIVMFGDAGQRLEKSAVRELVANFADASVGAVSGALVLLDRDAQEAADGAGLYWRYEKKLRAMESDIHSVPGATGAIYAIRRRLFVPLPPGTILDDVVVTMRIVLEGKRAILDPAARAYGVATQSPDIEYEKKKRTLTGNYQLFAEMPELFVPWRNPIFVQLVSHKAGRLIVPYCLAALFISNLCLRGGLYRTGVLLQGTWYIMACAGWWASRGGESRLGKLMAIPYAFVLMNWAAVAGLYYFVRGRALGIWNSAAVEGTEAEGTQEEWIG
jgi:cellulose synthase/poly-beta-1,6-N-acetylglucosamine synthase-like glycosyltransferase